jgi:hypothetical protein
MIAKGGPIASEGEEALIKGVFDYLAANRSRLKKGDEKAVGLIRAKLLEQTQDTALKSNINDLFNRLISEIEKPPSAIPSEIPATQRIEETLIIQAPPPKTLQDLTANLTLVHSHYPKYQLGHNLEVYDTRYGQLPRDWNPELVRQKLDIFLKFQRPPGEKIDIEPAVHAMHQLLKPIQPVKLTIDRPFIFLIRDEPTNTLLFAGRVLDPAK